MRVCACLRVSVCVCAAYPVPNPLSPTEREAAQEDYAKQSHFVQPPACSRALFPQFRAAGSASTLKLPIPGGSCSSKSPQEEGGNQDLAPPRAVPQSPCSASVPLCAHSTKAQLN